MKHVKKALAAKVSFKEQVKKGDLVQSFDITGPVDPTRGSWIGKVVSTEMDNGVEYVIIETMFYIWGGVVEKHKKTKIRAPQNGIPTSTDGITDGIKIIGK